MVDLMSILQHVTGWLSDNEALCLNQSAARVKAPNVIVEIGSFQGKSTIALALNSSVPVFAIDPHEAHTDEIGGVFGPADRAKFHENIVAAGVHERVCPINLTSDAAYAGWHDFIGLLFIDGAHNYEQIERDIQWASWMDTGGLLCVHDKTWGDVERILFELNRNKCLKRLSDCDSMAIYEVVKDE
jgi:predicted O-methyltransferase YrrM